MASLTFEELRDAVVIWAGEKGILDKSNPSKQMLKTMEEVGELASSIAKGNKEKAKDDIGDVIVTLILQAHMQGLDVVDCVEHAYTEIAGRTGQMIDGIFVKDADLKPEAKQAAAPLYRGMFQRGENLESLLEPWTPWGGGPLPVLPNEQVEVRLRDGEVLSGPARLFWWDHARKLSRISKDRDIVGYKVIRPKMQEPEPADVSEGGDLD